MPTEAGTNYLYHPSPSPSVLPSEDSSDHGTSVVILAVGVSSAVAVVFVLGGFTCYVAQLRAKHNKLLKAREAALNIDLDALECVSSAELQAGSSGAGSGPKTGTVQGDIELVQPGGAPAGKATTRRSKQQAARFEEKIGYPAVGAHHWSRKYIANPLALSTTPALPKDDGIALRAPAFVSIESPLAAAGAEASPSQRKVHGRRQRPHRLGNTTAASPRIQHRHTGRATDEGDDEFGVEAFSIASFNTETGSVMDVGVVRQQRIAALHNTECVDELCLEDPWLEVIPEEPDTLDRNLKTTSVPVAPMYRGNQPFSVQQAPRSPRHSPRSPKQRQRSPRHPHSPRNEPFAIPLADPSLIALDDSLKPRFKELTPHLGPANACGDRKSPAVSGGLTSTYIPSPIMQHQRSPVVMPAHAQRVSKQASPWAHFVDMEPLSI